MQVSKVQFRNFYIITSTFFLCFLLLLPLLNMISQSSFKTQDELYDLKNCFYEMLERDLSTNDRLNSRMHYGNYFPSYMLASFLKQVNAQYTAYANDAEDKKKIQNILSHHKLLRQKCCETTTLKTITITNKLLAIEDPTYDKGWNQYRLFLDVLKSSVRSQIALEDGLFQKVNIPFFSSSSYFRDYFIVKYLKIDDLCSSRYHKNIFHAHLSSYALIRVGTHNLDTRNNIFLNTRISHSRVTNTVTLYVDFLTTERTLQKSFELHDMEKLIVDSEIEYRPLCNK
jgi:hypothetical protein